jgi:hypothetical protein
MGVTHYPPNTISAKPITAMTVTIAMATEQEVRHTMFVSSLAFLPFGFSVSPGKVLPKTKNSFSFS